MQKAKVEYIKSPSEIPAGQQCILVLYGEEYAQTRHARGITITVARQQSRTVSELSFLTAVHTAKRIAKQEGISTIFVFPLLVHPELVIPNPSAVVPLPE